jgi:integrative and conjugative element protein (TIGR02256 family)
MAGKFARALVAKKALAQLRREIRAARLKETGGALVGYFAGDAVHVTAASGPGPKAIRRMFSVEIDGAFAKEFCDAEFKKSDGLVDYVGDWHCHPYFSTRPSGPDYEAMNVMSGFAGSPTRTPITLIYSRLTSRFSVYLFDGRGKLKILKTARQKT